MLVAGRACLFLAVGLCAYGAIASVVGARRGRAELTASGRRAVYALALVLTIAFAILEAAFLRSDFSFRVVGTHSSTTTPAFYRATAVWSSQEGSLLLWVWLLSVWSSLVLARVGGRLRDITPYATAVLLGVAGFFAGLTAFLANPFRLASPVPPEGVGLEPLLRHPSMMVHPPMLYSGYTLCIVPFAFAIGALIARRLEAEWLGAVRRFALAAWFFLGIGILLGARWSWSELGWGGYWAWDPVENAALMPWLTGTALLHSLMVQQRRGMLKAWNASLVLATGFLAVLGTFLVRSGILESIHAFGASTLGIPFVMFIALMTLASVALVVWRRASLRSQHKLDSLLSREAIFLLNNLVLVGLCFVVFWGTFFPLISEALTGDKASVGPPWFDRYTVPLALVLVLLSGIGPVIAWRKASLRGLARNLAAPLTAGLAVPILLLALGVSGHPSALIMFGCGAFALTAVGQEFWRGAGARRAMTGDAPPTALLALVRRNRRRYGGYVVHAGMAVLFIGVAASSAFAHQRDARLSPGQTTKVGGYDVRYVKPTFDVAHDRRDTGAIVSLGAVLDVSKNGKHVTTLNPSRGYYPSLDVAQDGPVGRFYKGESTSEVGLRAGLRRDLWTAIEPDTSRIDRLAGVADRKFPDATPRLSLFIAGTLAAGYAKHPPPATFRVIDSPLVTWIWLGGLIVVAGALIALWPAGLRARRTAPAGYGARVARELGRA
ncbi:MAG: heme lyase CcmF/NrfE family subunit [Solirubrobacteraceae bacterium]